MTGTSTRTEPIRIPVSQDGEAFSLSSGTSFLSPSIALDGPLHALLPELSLKEGDAPHHRRAGDPAFCSLGSDAPETATSRRRLSGLSAFLSSPPRSSPLSRSVLENGEEDSDGFVAEANRWRTRRRLSSSFGSPPGPGATMPDPWTSRSHRRKSSFSSAAAAAAAKCGSFTGSSPFIGSFEDSLLQGRMSAPPSAFFDFVASIGVLGSSDLPIHRRCPPHLHVPFLAVFYASHGDPRSSPYVGTIDLYRHYLHLLNPVEVTGDASPSTNGARLPRFPGYPVPERGQVQIVLKDSNETAFRPFLVPYDLTGLDRGGEGGRTFVRQKSYAVDQVDGKGRLCFAIHLQFCSPPERKRSRRVETSPRAPRYYLYHTIRVVFESRGSDLSDEWRVVCETPVSGSSASANADSPERFSPYPGPPDEWKLARKKAKERLKVSGMARLEASTSTLEPSRPDPPITTTALSHVLVAPPVVVSTTVPSHHPVFSFDRVPSPAPSQLEKRSVSALSALRPTEPQAAPARPPPSPSPPSTSLMSSPSHPQPQPGAEREMCGR
ncbi:hypothetical protein JCM3774_005520 [Rhodotorula dairenensis]